MFTRKLTFQNLLCTFIFIGFALALTVSAQAQNLVWAKGAGGGGRDSGFGIAVMPDGSALVTGSFQKTAIFGKGESGETALTSAGGSDIFVAKYSPDGTLAWAKRAGSTENLESGEDIAVLPDGSALVTGDFHSTATFGQGESGETVLPWVWSYDIFVAKYNADGTLAWAKAAGGTSADVSYGIAALPDGSAVATGSFYGTATFNPGESCETTLTSAGTFDIFIARYNPDGSLAWAKRAGGSHYFGDWGLGIAALDDGSALVTGYFSDTAMFGQGESNETTLATLVSDDSDIFVARYNPDGTLAWAKRAGAIDTGDAGRDIAILPDGTAFVTGYFWTTATFGPGESGETTLTSAGLRDMFIARYNPDGTLAWAKRAGGSSFWDEGNGIAVLPDGSALVTGFFYGTATFGPGETGETILTSAGNSDVYVARYYPDGRLDWVKQAGSSMHAFAYGIGVLPDESALITGDFQYPTITFGPGESGETTLTSANGYDIFVAKFAGTVSMHADSYWSLYY